MKVNQSNKSSSACTAAVSLGGTFELSLPKSCARTSHAHRPELPEQAVKLEVASVCRKA